MPLIPEQIAFLNSTKYANGDYGTVDINGVTYPTLDVGNLTVTAGNFTFANLATLLPGLTKATVASGVSPTSWTTLSTNNTPAFAFVDVVAQNTDGIVSDMSLSQAATYGNKVARGPLFNWYAIAVINAYLDTQPGGWRVLTECDAKHMKNAWSYPAQGGYGGCGLGITFSGLGVTSSTLSGNISDSCSSQFPTSASGLGAAISSTVAVTGATVNAQATNLTGYSTIVTGFIANNAGVYSGLVNSNIWTSTDCNRQYSGTTLLDSTQAWRGFANFAGAAPQTSVDQLPNPKGHGFAIRLCRTNITTYDFSGSHDVPSDTGTLVVGQPITVGTVTSTIDYTNTTGTWRINKCQNTVNQVTATAGVNGVPGWDKLLSPDPGSGDPASSGNIIVTFSGTPVLSGSFTWNLPIGCDIISITRTVNATPPSISELDCAGANGTVVEDIVDGLPVVPPATFTVTYTGGNGESYPLQSFNSTGVTGLTATLAAGTLNTGSGSLTFTITGTPSGDGGAVFPISFAGATCDANIKVIPNVGTITGVSGCTNATLVNGPLIDNNAVSPGTTFSIDYTGGNGLLYNSQTVASTGVTGLTASLTSGYLNNGNGTFVFTITGTPVGSGTASFPVSFTGQNDETVSCTVTILVEIDGPSITSLICNPIELVGGPLLEGAAIPGVSFTILYSGGNGLPYLGQTIASTGVTGITATLSAGTLNNGSGSFTYDISGIPVDNGTAGFAIVFNDPIGGEVTCNVTVPVTPVVLLSYLGCDNATYSPDFPPFNVGEPITSDISIPYTSTQGGVLAEITVNSTGVTGLTITLDSTTVPDDSTGTFSGSISGTPTEIGDAIFTICVGGYFGEGQTCCTLIIPIQEVPASIGALNCGDAVYSGQIEFPGNYGAVDNVTVTIPYTGGNGGLYPYTFAPAVAPGVTGLEINTPSGNFAGSPDNLQNGTITFTVIGIPSGVGVATFPLIIGGQTCDVFLNITNAPGEIDSLNCIDVTTSAQVLSGQPVDGITLYVPYTGGNGGTYSPQTITSTPAGVTGSLLPGTLAVGDGVLSIELSGIMPTGFVPIEFEFSFPSGSEPCTITLTPPVDEGTADLDCESISTIGIITYPDPIPVNNPVQVWVTYNNSNGGSYGPSTFPSVSPGVGGLTATLEAGQFGEGSGSILLLVTGTPQSSGVATFNISVGGSDCVIGVTVEAPIGEIDALNCSSNGVTVNGNLVNGEAASSVSFTVPYFGSNGGTYPENIVNSTNIVTALTATLDAGLFTQPNGTVTYAVTGTPLGVGTASFSITIGNQTCIVSLTVDPQEGTISTINCGSATFSGTPVEGIAASINGSILYTGGNGGIYASYTDTVNGLTLTIPGGLFNVGNGSFPFTIEGTALESGTVTFSNIAIGGQLCNLSITVLAPPPIIGELLCTQVSIAGWLVVNQAASGVTITVPYDGSNSQPYPENTSNSTGVTGLTATAPAGTLTSPTGQVVYTVTGTPTTTGVATFTVTVGTQTCVINIPVSQSSFFGPENPSPCQEVTYTDPGCEVLGTTCTILLNGTEVSYSTLGTTDPCQVSFQVPCDTVPNSIAEVTFLDCEDNVITVEDLPIGDLLSGYLLQSSGCPGDQITAIDTGCIYIPQIDNIEVCTTLGCVPITTDISVFNNPPLPCSFTVTLPSVIPVVSYPSTVDIVINGVSGELLRLPFDLQNCGSAANSFDSADCALPGDQVTFINPGCDIVNPDLTQVIVDGIVAEIVELITEFPCSVTFIIPTGAGPGTVDIQFLDNLGNVLSTEKYSIAAEGVGSLYTVTFTPQVEGCHRIYFRTSQEEYCYYQADGSLGVPVTVTIDLQDYAECLVTVPPVSCDDTITVTGYIQPCCTPVDSQDNIIELNCVQYTTNDCGLYSIVCNSSNCGTFTKSNCFASGCTGINDLTEYAFRGNSSIPNNTLYLCSEGNGIQNTTNSTYTITKISSTNAIIYGDDILQGDPFIPSNWSNGGGAEWNPVDVCPSFTDDHLYVPEETTTGTSTTPGPILTIGNVYEFSFIMYSDSPNIITFSSGNSLAVSSPGGTYPPVGTTYQITAQTDKLEISIPSVDQGTCFQLLSLREIQPNVTATCCTCFGAEIEMELPEEGLYSIDVYYTECTENGPQLIRTTFTNPLNIIPCCTYGSFFPVNKFDIQYITSVKYTDQSAC
jgi:hypothetical protein